MGCSSFLRQRCGHFSALRGYKVYQEFKFFSRLRQERLLPPWTASMTVAVSIQRQKRCPVPLAVDEAGMVTMDSSR